MATANGGSHRSRRTLAAGLCAIALVACAAATPASAQTDASSYPDRPVRIIVPYPPGGGADILARVVAEKMQARWNQPMVIENRSGAGGNVGTEAVFRAAPDGYTVLFTAQPPLVSNEALYGKLNFDPKALASISVMAVAYSVLVVNPNLPVKNLQEFIAYAKANPGKLNYASQGVGNAAHLTAELFNMMAGTKMVHIPYAGTNPALTDLIAGHVEVMFGELATNAAFIKTGKLRLLGFGGEKRHPEWPEVPAIAETLPGFLAKIWQGMVAPPGTPDAITRKWAAGIDDILKMPDVTERLAKLYMTPAGGTPQDMDRFLKEERERWTNVVRVSGARIQ
jgi:tripartite-type tricarboxylate transporter receptor subunit TctC